MVNSGHQPAGLVAIQYRLLSPYGSSATKSGSLTLNSQNSSSRNHERRRSGSLTKLAPGIVLTTLVVVGKPGRQLREHGLGVGYRIDRDMVALESVNERSAMPLL
jgi:hypothetical protein